MAETTENEVINKICPECKAFYGVEVPLRRVNAYSVILYQCPSCKTIYNKDIDSTALEEYYGNKYDMYMQRNNLIQRSRGM